MLQLLSWVAEGHRQLSFALCAEEKAAVAHLPASLGELVLYFGNDYFGVGPQNFLLVCSLVLQCPLACAFRMLHRRRQATCDFRGGQPAVDTAYSTSVAERPSAQFCGNLKRNGDTRVQKGEDVTLQRRPGGVDRRVLVAKCALAWFFGAAQIWVVYGWLSSGLFLGLALLFYAATRALVVGSVVNGSSPSGHPGRETFVGPGVVSALAMACLIGVHAIAIWYGSRGRGFGAGFHDGDEASASTTGTRPATTGTTVPGPASDAGGSGMSGGGTAENGERGDENPCGAGIDASGLHLTGAIMMFVVRTMTSAYDLQDERCRDRTVGGHMPSTAIAADRTTSRKSDVSAESHRQCAGDGLHLQPSSAAQSVARSQEDDLGEAAQTAGSLGKNAESSGERAPAFLAYMANIYFFPGVLCGPCQSFREFMDFIEEQGS